MYCYGNGKDVKDNVMDIENLLLVISFVLLRYPFHLNLETEHENLLE